MALRKSSTVNTLFWQDVNALVEAAGGTGVKTGFAHSVTGADRFVDLTQGEAIFLSTTQLLVRASRLRVADSHSTNPRQDLIYMIQLPTTGTQVLWGGYSRAKTVPTLQVDVLEGDVFNAAAPRQLFDYSSTVGLTQNGTNINEDTALGLLKTNGSVLTTGDHKIHSVVSSLGDNYVLKTDALQFVATSDPLWVFSFGFATSATGQPDTTNWEGFQVTGIGAGSSSLLAKNFVAGVPLLGAAITISNNTNHWITTTRTPTSLTVQVYSDAGRTTLVGTSTVATPTTFTRSFWLHMATNGTVAHPVTSQTTQQSLNAGAQFFNATTVTFTANTHATLDRLDIIQANFITGIVTKKEGTTAVRATVDTDNIKLADVDTPPLSGNITQADIFDQRNPLIDAFVGIAAATDENPPDLPVGAVLIARIEVPAASSFVGSGNAFDSRIILSPKVLP